MTRRPGGWVNPEDLFNMSVSEFLEFWGLTPHELKRELVGARLVGSGIETPRGYDDVRFYLPAIRAWVAIKRKMPPLVRAKVEAAGGLDRLDQWRGDQVMRCKFDVATNSMTLPDGTTLRDVQVRKSTRH